MARIFDSPITTNDQGIDRVLAAGLPVILVFVDGSLPPGLAETMDRLARENAGDLLVVKVPLKDSPNAQRRFGIVLPPAVTAVSNRGQVLSKSEGINPEEVARHTAYLLGKGPKPEGSRPAPGAAKPESSPSTSERSASASVSGQPYPVTDATFDQEVLRSPQPVVVDFWAPWCGPCRMVEPTVEKLAREHAGKVRFAKVNVDENPVVAQRYGVQSIPTMMVVKNGQIIDRWAGALPEGPMRSRLAPHLG